MRHPSSGTPAGRRGTHSCRHICRVSLQRAEIAERALGLHELQVHQRAGRIINEDKQSAGRPAVLEPVMIGAIDLDQLANAFPAQARLVKRAALLPREPNPGVLHPFAERLAGDLQPVVFIKLLNRECRAEVDVVLTDQRHRELPNRRINPVVRHTTAGLVPDRRRTFRLKRLQKPVNLSATQSQHVGPIYSRHPALAHLA